MAEAPKVFRLSNRWLSVILVAAVTLVALFLGRVLKDTVETQTFQVERSGVKANIAKGWLVQNGIEGESTLFSTSDPFNQLHRYIISQLPVVPNGHLTDSVVTRNFVRAQELQNYQVIEQTGVRIGNENGFRVKYTYVSTPKFSKIPVVMLGVDFYLPDRARIVVASMEDQSTDFEQAYPAFIRFLNGLAFTSGG